MERLQPSQTLHFLKRFRFGGGLLKEFRISNLAKADAQGMIRVTVQEGNQTRRLRIRFSGVEEFRFQRRPGPGLVRLKEVRLGYFNALFYLNLDAFADDGPLAVHDFRASDAFIASRELSWEIVLPKDETAKPI